MRKGKRKHLEEDIQAACVEWFRCQYAKFSEYLFAIPNALAFTGGSRGAFFRKLQRLKSMGLVAGVPDLFLAIPRGTYAGAFIEMKAPGKKLEAHQKALAVKFSDAGYFVAVCDDFDKFVFLVKDYLSKGIE